jgi:MarR family transcriptional regulator, organic hydroperoxide resistance regulator
MALFPGDTLKNLEKERNYFQNPFMETDDRIIYIITETQRSVMAHLKDRLISQGLTITPVQAGILFLLTQQDSRTMTDLSRLLFTDNSSMTRLVDRLEKAGLVKRLADPKDRRALFITITEEGRKQAVLAKKTVKRVNQEIKTRLSPEELEVFKKVLGRLTRTYQKNR